MYILLVHYRQSEQSGFTVYEPDTIETARDFLKAPLQGHSCGYLITKNDQGVWSCDGLPMLQRRRFAGSVSILDLLNALKSRAQPMTPADITKLHKLQSEVASEKSQKEKGIMAKEKKEAKAANGEKRTRRPALDPATKINKIAEEAPHRKDSVGHKNWSLVRNGMSVAKFTEAGGQVGYLRYWADAGKVQLTPPG